MVSASATEPRDSQNLVQQGYGMRQSARASVLQVENREAARRWLRSILEHVAFVGDHDKLGDADEILHIAFSAPGLAALGYANWLESMSVAYGDGVHAEHRSRILGDVGLSDPARWQWGSGERLPHVLLLSYRRPGSQAPGEGGVPDGLRELHATPLTWDRQGHFVREHFGFADGIGQPEYVGLSRKASANHGAEPIALGELLLGYADERKRHFDRPIRYALPEPQHAGVLRDGTYLVARQLEQNVFDFWRELRALGKSASERLEIATRLIGRGPDGRPLAKRGPNDAELTHDRFDAFDYQHDADGSGCPFGAHVRRTHPRDSLPGENRKRALSITRRHRILRRGRTYGPVVDTPGDCRITHVLECSDAEFEALATRNAAPERGLFFVGLCADIARQFEFLQQNWVHGSLLAGRGGEPDPLIGSVRLPGPRYFTSFGRPVGTRFGLAERPPVVVRGGGYFFLPGRKALEALAG